MSRTKLILALLLTAVLLLLGGQLAKNRRDTEHLELVLTVGMDYDGRSLLTLQQSRMTSGGEGGEGGEGGGESGSAEGKTTVITTDGRNYTEAMRTAGEKTDMDLNSDHIHQLVIGERAASDNIRGVMSFLMDENNFQPNSYIYVAKDSTAKEFIGQIKKLDYDMDEKVNDLMNNSSGGLKNVLDFLRTAAGNEAGIIPAVKITTVDGSELTDETESDNITVDFDGSAVINNGRLVGYLDKRQTAICNLLYGTMRSDSIEVDAGRSESATLTTRTTSSSIVFNLKDDELVSCDVNCLIKMTTEETPKDHLADTSRMEALAAERYTEEIRATLDRGEELDADFLALSNLLRREHPHFAKAHIDELWQLVKDVPVNVNVNVNVSTSK